MTATDDRQQRNFAAVMAIHFHLEDIRYSWKNKRTLKAWIQSAIAKEGKKAGDINIILCSDAYLLNMNQQFLEHDYYTDIITFDYCEGDRISGDLFISIERVSDNALKEDINKEKELYRIVIHGIMHLCGYKDKTPMDEKKMREKENFYLMSAPEI